MPTRLQAQRMNAGRGKKAVAKGAPPNKPALPAPKRMCVMCTCLYYVARSEKESVCVGVETLTYQLRRQVAIISRSAGHARRTDTKAAPATCLMMRLSPQKRGRGGDPKACGGASILDVVNEPRLAREWVRGRVAEGDWY